MILQTIITTLFLCIILSYYILLIIKKKKLKKEKDYSSISIIIPAHNEEDFIKDCINSVKNAEFNGKKEIIIINDGSSDKTQEIISQIKNIKIIQTKHIGKSASINKALKIANGEIIAIVDADSVIEKNSLNYIKNELEKENVAGTTSIIKVKNRKKLICMWVHIEQLYNSLMRLILSKINANISTPGPLSAYRKDALKKINGFSTKGYSEDLDITIRLIRQGYKITLAKKAYAQTNMPYTRKWFFKQRLRFAKGMLNIFKTHLRLNKNIIDLYTLPILLFTYLQAIIMGSFSSYQIISGYYNYFIIKGTAFSLGALKFFFEWFSIVGFIKWSINIISGNLPLTIIAILGIISTALSYPLYFISIFKFDKKFDIYHLIPIFFMYPFWLLIMIIYIISLPEIFKKKQYNIWEKKD